MTFDKLTHTYFNNEGKPMISVTTAIKKYILPNLYAGVKDDVLAAAAQRGNDIHTRIDAIEKGFPFADNANFPEVVAYLKWKEDNERKVMNTEMAVTDDRLIAGTIDQVEDTGDFKRAICDLKTTSVVNTEYLEWQLSLYAYLLENTYGFEVTELYCLHLRGDKCEKVVINRLPDTAILALLTAIEEDAETFDNPMKASCTEADDLVARYKALSIEALDYEVALKQKKAEMDAILASLKTLCDERGQREMETAHGLVKRGKDTIRNTFSKDIFLAKHPDMQEDIESSTKATTIEGKVTIKLK